MSSLLPAYPTGDDDSVRAWPKKFLKLFPTFDAYKQWFLKLIGIQGNPAASRKIIDWAKTQGIKLTPVIIAKLPKEWKEGLPKDMGVSIPYGYPRAFTYNPSEEQLETLYDLFEWTWGTREITFCDPMSGGGSIPFEALRFGLTVHANELNPVASVILKATLDYPLRFGPSLADDVRKYGDIWCDRIRQRLEPFYPLADRDENIFCYVWARTVTCPSTGKVVPLSPNWWLKKAKDSKVETWIGARPIALKGSSDVSFEIVHGKAAAEFAAKGSVKGGSGVSPWSPDVIDGNYIKAEAQAGRMGHQLYSVGIKTGSVLSFRSPSAADFDACSRAELELSGHRAAWESAGLLPIEKIGDASNYDRGHRLYGIHEWSAFFSARQQVAFATALGALQDVDERLLADAVTVERRLAIRTMLSLAIDKGLNYNCIQTMWHSARTVVVNKFNKHNFTFQWSYAELDAARNLFPWTIDQIVDAFDGISRIASPASSLFIEHSGRDRDRLTLTTGTAQSLSSLESGSVLHAGQSHVASVFGPIIARKVTSSIVKFCTVEF